jgi:hypothetical protein
MSNRVEDMEKEIEELKAQVSELKRLKAPEASAAERSLNEQIAQLKKFKGEGPHPKHDPMEHLNKYKCSKGHSRWNESKVVFVIDHQAHMVECLDCKKHYFIHVGMNEVEEVPADYIAELDEARKGNR